MNNDEAEAINKDDEEIYDKNLYTQKVFGVSSDGEEGYPNFYEYSFNWKWKLFFWAVFITPIVVTVTLATLIVRYFFHI